MRRTAALLAVALLAAPVAASDLPGAPRDADGRFRSLLPIPSRSAMSTVGIMLRQTFAKPDGTVPDTPPAVQPITRATLDAAPDGSAWRLGHSTLLVRLGGAWVLTDPMLGDRASPISFAGPKRFHPSPIAADELPPLDAVVVSHDHYDHLDHGTVMRLAPKVGMFVVPLGVGDRLIEWGVDAAKVKQLDWWQSHPIGGVTLTSVPSRHFSGRTLADRNSTLWSSWVMASDSRRLFFSGDTGWHAEFATIGERFGPFDATFIECGSYSELWPDVHLTPEQAVDAHRALRGRLFVPVHNTTFDMAFHPWREPIERAGEAAKRHDVRIAVPGFGERIALQAEP